MPSAYQWQRSRVTVNPRWRTRAGTNLFLEAETAEGKEVCCVCGRGNAQVQTCFGEGRGGWTFPLTTRQSQLPQHQQSLLDVVAKYQ